MLDGVWGTYADFKEKKQKGWPALAGTPAEGGRLHSTNPTNESDETGDGFDHEMMVTEQADQLIQDAIKAQPWRKSNLVQFTKKVGSEARKLWKCGKAAGRTAYKVASKTVTNALSD